MDDPPIEKISIPGPLLSSLLQLFASSPADTSGYIFGHLLPLSPSPPLHDDSDPPPFPPSSPPLFATITSLFSSPNNPNFLSPLASSTAPLLGWFSARRQTPLRPSMREFSISKTLFTQTPNAPSPCIFLILSGSFSHQPIHTHEYRAFQFKSDGTFEPKPLQIVNIGPDFRPHYNVFSPISPIPSLALNECEEDKRPKSLSEMKGEKGAIEQKAMDACAEGFSITRLGRLMGSEPARYTAELEELYGKMLKRLESLAQQVVESSAKLLEQVWTEKDVSMVLVKCLIQN
ncbi:uncharacterized protein LOC18423466 isoform X1 [Amborella trichopoda]|uniref:uncharacterized protein LOC18423466 isoform X1 n=1 Tax=Amborella trichopoda TaxID=13333 RepID=UPI0009BE6752|nr:uncharacterized protein LOC18423466 isoform X1 [Amborella trichopoda]|eukprot:XP_020530786.1 uncharacterized protein LOC18423466 isoform X1 [Amborella trichopoda]